MLFQRVLIRKKKGANVLAEVYESRVITQEKPTKILIEVANSNINSLIYEHYPFLLCIIISILGGSIRVYTEKLKSQPLIAILEENPLPIQYISFASFESSETQFFYNCSHIDTSIKAVMG